MNSKSIKKMKKHPLQIKNEDLPTLKFKPMRIHIGKFDDEKVLEVLEGEFIGFTLAANPPHLPATFDFQTKNGTVKNYTFFDLKYYEEIE
jgi:hypothetical protein